MTIYDFICQQWPNHAQRIIEATQEQQGTDFLTRDVDTTDPIGLTGLFLWSDTAEGHGYWHDLDQFGEAKERAQS